MNSDRDSVKIHFKLEQDEDGYPPVEWESLWAVPMDDGNYPLNNSPFHVPGLSSGDMVSARAVGGRLEISSLVASGGHSAIRVIAFDEGWVAALRASLLKLGASCEVSNIPGFFVVDVPPQVAYQNLDFLDRHLECGDLDYEESALRH